MTPSDPGERPEPEIDQHPAEGPGGIDAVPDWEAAGPDPVTPDQPRSAQVAEQDVPEEIERLEEMDEEDGSGSEPDDDAAEAPEQDSPA